MVGWGGIFATRICLGLSIFEEFYCLRSRLGEKSTVTYKPEYPSLRVHAILSHHWLPSNHWNECEAISEMFESGSRGGHKSL